MNVEPPQSGNGWVDQEPASVLDAHADALEMWANHRRLAGECSKAEMVAARFRVCQMRVQAASLRQASQEASP